MPPESRPSISFTYASPCEERNGSKYACPKIHMGSMVPTTHRLNAACAATAHRVLLYAPARRIKSAISPNTMPKPSPMGP